MTTRLVLTAALALFLFGASGRAQPPGPSGPRVSAPFSPYLNLTRSGVPPAINYYGIVRPQVQFANSIQMLQTQVVAGPFAVPDAGSEQSVVTGQRFGFQNHLGYFQNQNSFGNLGGAQPGPATGRVSPGLGVPNPPRRR